MKESPFAPENLVSRDELDSPVPRVYIIILIANILHFEKEGDQVCFLIIIRSIVIPEKAAPHVTGTALIEIEDCWPCFADGLSAVTAIGTQLRDLMKSGLTRWRLAV